MKLSKELTNGFIIFLGISIYFLFINAIGYGDKAYLRMFNGVFVLYGVNRTLKMNISEGKVNFVSNAISAIKTSLIGVFLSVIGLLIFSYINGGDSYVQNLPKTFLFTGNPTIVDFCLSLLFEGVASSVIVALLLMLYWNDKYKAD
ncbi:hypothetical protein [Flavobacterium cellulosilyticum]|uniref:DUF4199 domain-containing protein n=1 Tax=Flavobacterium cellulosilyticum TaxID=2541731 RepID=A0A4R5CHI4_9FLAO|nr:hypothetical protein [Flavobacterium cellulosilyticum]TDD99601.1 hypothetical protein E0F76_02425 [Flavobacterium cellulosilyticum]